MDGREELTAGLRRRLESEIEDTHPDSASWQITVDGPITVRLPDRELTVEGADGPDGVRWTVVLRSDGAVVSKFGQFDTLDAVVEKVRSLLDAEVRYTVCCDG
jgi:hypothetical protein